MAGDLTKTNTSDGDGAGGPLVRAARAAEAAWPYIAAPTGPTLVPTSLAWMDDVVATLLGWAGFADPAWLLLIGGQGIGVLAGLGLAVAGSMAIYKRKEASDKLRQDDHDELVQLRKKVNEHDGVVATAQKAQAQLEQEAHALFSKALSGQLLAVCRAAGLESSERVSLYLHQDVGGKAAFVRVGRRSPNPMFETSGRGIYPTSGAVGAAWSTGSCFEDIHANPETNLDGYAKEQHRKFDVQTAIAREFTMKSRSYAGYRLNDLDEPVGVLLFESLNNGWQKSSPLGAASLREERNTLVQLLRTGGTFLPDASTASKKGF